MNQNQMEQVAARLAELAPGTLLCQGTADAAPRAAAVLRAGRGEKGSELSRPVYPGMTVTALTYLAERTASRPAGDPGALEIHYCRSGRIGWTVRDGSTLYLGPGDFCVCTEDLCAGAVMTLPNGYYEGLTIRVELYWLERRPPELLRPLDLTGAQLLEKFCPRGSFTVVPGSERTESLFAGFYGQPQPLQEIYDKLKLQELLLYLYRAPRAAEPGRYPAGQIECVRQVHELLTQRLDQRITIEALSRQFLMNPSTLKQVFKAVYGNSIAAHIHEHRMERAAQLLRQTDAPMAEIARAVGYESASKFSAEFRKAYQLLPSEYRKAHKTG